jgi:hypothetical protein
MDRTVTFKHEETSGHEPQPGLDTKTNRLIDRQSQCDFDFDFDLTNALNPCGGGVEYLHRDPVSRRRRRKGKSQI